MLYPPKFEILDRILHVHAVEKILHVVSEYYCV